MPWWHHHPVRGWEPMTRSRPRGRDHVRARDMISPNSWWFRLLPDAPPVADDSDQIITNWKKTPGFNFNRDAYTPQIILASPDDPVVTFTYTGAGNGDALIRDHFTDIRMPAWAAPAEGSDAEACIWNPEQDTLTEAWGATKTADDQWTVKWGGTIRRSSLSDGVHEGSYGVQATSFSFPPGMITADEVRDGWIGHVVAVAAPVVMVNNTVSLPAHRTDGDLTGPGLISEGQRLFIPRDADLSGRSLNPFVRLVVRAAQEYGLIVSDRGGNDHSVIRGTNSLSYTKDPWPELLGGVAGDPLAGFPTDLLRVMPRDWMPTSGAPTMAYPDLAYPENATYPA